MAASEVTENLLLSIRRSPLNFFISETPYSVQICLRKRFRKDADVSPGSGLSVAESPVRENYSEAVKNFEKDLEVLKGENDSLQKENLCLSNAEKDFIQKSVKQKATLDRFSDEIKVLKGVIEKSKLNFDQIHGDLVQSKKVVKEKEKEIYNLTKTLDNKNSHITSLKQSSGDLKSDKSKLETKIKTLEKKCFKQASSKASQTVYPIKVSPSSTNSTAMSSPSLSFCRPTSPSLSSIPWIGSSILTTKSANSTEKVISSMVPFSLSSPLSTTLFEPDPTPWPPLPTCSRPPPTAEQPCKSVKSSSHSDCNHKPQCITREPNPPPPFAPITAHEFYSPPDPPPFIKLLPSEVETFQDFKNLNSSHKCEECEQGGLYSNFHQMVHYPDPGPCGGTSGQPVKSCPNHPNAEIRIVAVKEAKKFKKKKFSCDACSDRFSETMNLIFHRNRKHKLKS
jgi:hypothetical protein